MKKLIIANWKMNPLKGVEARKMFQGINTVAAKLKNVETVVCPPLIYLESLGEKVTTRSCVLGAQDAFWEHSGSYTGQVSPDMIFNARARYIIVGHSEVRALGQTDEILNKKIKSILQFPLIPIICVGEQERDEDAGHIKFIKHQVTQALKDLTTEEVSRVVIAYEPIWAIGEKAKHVCTPAECREVIQNIRHVLADIFGNTEAASRVPILYGGSVTDENTQAFLEDGLTNGLLVGRASLDPKMFVKILKIAEKASE
jgi:triosephosphate isomerase